MQATSFNRLDYSYKLLVIIALSITGVVLTKDIVIPMAFAAFLSVVMLPLIKRMEQRKIHTVVATLLVLVGFTILVILLGWLIVDQLVALVNNLPDLQSRLEVFVTGLSATLKNDFGISISEQNSFIKETAKSVSSYLGDVLLSTSNLLSLIIQIPIYIFLFLIYRKKFKIFFQKLLPENEEMQWKKDMEDVLQGYVTGLSLVTLLIAALNTIGLAILGIEHAIFFGLLSGLLTVIPYVGIFIGAALPTLIALITKDSVWYAVGVVSIFSFVQFLEGNFITPRITGSKVSINALAAIVALLLGSKILGIAGMILAVPAIGVLKILLGFSVHLKPFVVLLEDSHESEDIKKEKQEEIPPTPS